MDMKAGYGKLASKLKVPPLTGIANSTTQAGWFSPHIERLKNSLHQSSVYARASNLIHRFQVANNLFDIEKPEILALYEELRSQVGTQHYRSPAHTITQNQIVRFAAATGDYQWIHTDEARAKRESPFRSTIAHGFLIVSMLPVLRNLSDVESFRPAKLIVARGIDHLCFESPVKPGQRIEADFSLKTVGLGEGCVEISERVCVRLIDSGRTVFGATIISQLHT